MTSNLPNDMRRLLPWLVAAVATLGAAPPAGAAPDWQRVFPGADDDDDAPAVGPEEAPEHDRPIQGDHRIRLEAAFRLGPSIRSEVTHGPDVIATKLLTASDLHVPEIMTTIGWRALADVKVHRWISLGLHGTRLVTETGRRTVHYRGVGLQAVVFGPGSRIRTTLDALFVEAFARFVVRDDPEGVRFSIGVGGAWASHRIVLRRGDLTAAGRAETFFVPTLSSWLAVRLGATPLSLFLESTTGLFAPWRFPSLLSEFRAGVRWHLPGGVELVVAGATSSGRIEDTDDLWGGKYDPGDRRRRASWLAVTLDVGLSVTF